MSEYYAVVRSGDHLAHYGVKGMKWGVRKAIEKGNEKKLDRQYKKAQKKLEKLNKRADVNEQEKIAEKYNKVSKIARRVGHVGAVAGGLSFPYADQAEKLYTKQHNKYYGETTRALQKMYDEAEGKYNKDIYILNQIADNNKNGVPYPGSYTWNQHNNAVDLAESTYKKDIAAWKEASNKAAEQHRKDWQARDRRRALADVARTGGLGLAALGYGTAIGAKVKASSAKRRTTEKGHAKAVAERDAWKKEMGIAFKGTKYDNPGSKLNKRRK